MKRRNVLGWMAVILILVLALTGCGKDASSGSASGQGAVAQDSQAMTGTTALNETAAEGEQSQTDFSEDASENGESPQILTESQGADSYDQKLIRTVNMSVETKEFDGLIENLKAKTESLKGYVEKSEISGAAGETANRWAYLTLRIPAQQLDVFLDQVNDEANVIYSSESTEDVTLAYTDMQSHVTALRAEQETLLTMLEQAQSMEDILAIQTRLTQIRYEIESYESQLRVYDNQVDYSTVYLDVQEVARETSAEGSAFGDRVKIRFEDNVYRIGRGFVNFAVGFLGATPVLAILVVIVIVAIVVVKQIQKRKKMCCGRNKEKKKQDEEN